MIIFNTIKVLAVAVLISGNAMANDGTRKPTAQEIVDRLTPATEQFQARSFAPKTRSLTARGISVEGAKPVVEESPSIDLDVNFEYNSARLTPDARIMLDNLGQALIAPSLKKSRFLIAGHTDGAGSDAYNLALSVKRAQAVALYLTKQYGVEVSRLKVEGFGRTRLLDTANPANPTNRRVQVANLGAE